MPDSTIALWEDTVPGYESASPFHRPTLKPFLLAGSSPRPCVIVFPGGGYFIKAPHEADPVAHWLNKIGLSAFVLDYRVHPYRQPYPMMDGLRAVRLLRAHAEQYHLRQDQIGVLGFSAGGHLASTVATHWDRGDPTSPDPIERVSSRPNAQVLCYPVITFFEHRHSGSMEALLGEDPPQDLRRFLSSDLQVTEETPPAFLWHTANDSGVPVENSLLYAAALSKKRVPFELHIYLEGPHGMGLAEDDPGVKTWTMLCELWFKRIGFLP